MYQYLKNNTLPFAMVSALSIAAHANEVTLPQVEVVGRGEGQGYYSQDAQVGRTPTPLQLVPYAVRVVPRQAIDDVGAVRLEETYDYVSGVHRQNNLGGLWDNFSVRGFAGDPNIGAHFLRNGFAGNRGYNAPRDMANVEQIEFLKGPSSALYGGSEPGGILNIVTKQPQFKPAHAVQVSAGGDNNYRTTLDSTGPISDTLAYRLNVAYEDKGSFRDHINSQRYLFAPSFTWVAAPNTVVSYDLEVLQQKAPLDRGVIAINGKPNSIGRQRFLGEPGDGDITIDNKTHHLRVEHELSANWSTQAGLVYRTTALDGFSTEASPRTVGAVRWTTAGEPVIERERRYRNYSSDDLSMQAQLNGKFTAGGMQHTLLTGVDTYRFELDQLMRRGRSTADYGLNVHNPVYGQAPLPLNTTPTNTLEKQYGAGIFIQDQIALSPHWQLLAGLRHDQFRQTVDNRNNNTRTTQQHGVTTPRWGLTWLASPTVSVYGLVSESFRPNNGISLDSRAFAPERGQSKEVGLKYQSLDQRYGGAVSVFEIDKKNVLTNDPANAGFSIAAGQARSRGLELDASGQLTKQLRVLANYAYIDAQITKDSNAALVGTRLVNIPRHSASVLAMYESGTAAGRYGVGMGATYVGKRAGNAMGSFELPGYATARAMAYWKPTKNLRISLDIENLFNKNYSASSFDVYWITPGTPRTVTLQLQATF